jgi:hypothetical protein
MDKKNDQIAHRKIVAGREILRKYGQNNNSPATGRQEEKVTIHLLSQYQLRWLRG